MTPNRVSLRFRQFTHTVRDAETSNRRCGTKGGPVKTYWIMWYGERLYAKAVSVRQAVNYFRRRVRAHPYNCPAKLAASLIDTAYEVPVK